MTPELETLLDAATARPWFADQRNWRNQQTKFDWYIHGDVHPAIDEDSDDSELNRGSAVSVAIIPGNETSGDIPESVAKIVTIAVNHFERLVEFAERVRESTKGVQSPPECVWHEVANDLLASIEAAAKETP